DVEGTRSAIRRCLELDPGCEEARFLSANMDRRENKLEEAERQVRALLASDLKSAQIRYSCYAELAHILDRTKRFDEAIAVLEEGKQFSRQSPLNLSVERKAFYEEHERLVREAKSFPKNILQIWSQKYPLSARNVQPAVAFLTGSARSGTTLLEKVLD